MKCPCCDQEIKEEEETIIRLLKKILDKLEAIDKRPVYVPYQPFAPEPQPIPWYPPTGPIWTEPHYDTGTPIPQPQMTWCDTAMNNFAQNELDMEANDTPSTLCGTTVKWRYSDTVDA